MDDRLGLALIWLIETYASQLDISYEQAAEQIGLMCEITRILEQGAEVSGLIRSSIDFR